MKLDRTTTTMNEDRYDECPRFIEIIDPEHTEPCRYALADHLRGSDAAAIRQCMVPAAVRLMLIGIASVNGWDMSDTEYRFVYDQ